MSRRWEVGRLYAVTSWRGKDQLAFRTERGGVPGWCVLDGGDTRGLFDREVRSAVLLSTYPAISEDTVVVDEEDTPIYDELHQRRATIGWFRRWLSHGM